MDKKSKTILIISILILISLFTYTILLQKVLVNNQNQIIKTLSIENKGQSINQYTKLLIGKLDNVEDLWWNTIINQSGLSVIFAVVIIVMQIIFSELQKENFAKKIEENNKNYFKEINELENSLLTMLELTLAKRGPFETTHKFGTIGSIIDQLNIIRKMENNKNNIYFDSYKKELYQRYVDYYFKGIILPYIDTDRVLREYDKNWVNQILTEENVGRLVFFKTLNNEDRTAIVNDINESINQVSIDKFIKDRLIQKSFRKLYDSDKDTALKLFYEINVFVIEYMK